MMSMATRQILPTAMKYATCLGESVQAVAGAGIENAPQKKMLKKITILNW